MAQRELILTGHEGSELRCVLHGEEHAGVGVLFPGQLATARTPLLHDTRRVLEARGLAVLGTDDPLSDPSLLPPLGARTDALRIEDGDHSLEVGDPPWSVDALRLVVDAITRFLADR